MEQIENVHNTKQTNLFEGHKGCNTRTREQ